MAGDEEVADEDAGDVLVRLTWAVADDDVPSAGSLPAAIWT